MLPAAPRHARAVVASRRIAGYNQGMNKRIDPSAPHAGGRAPIQVSDAANARIRALASESNDPGLKLRLAVSGGGCSGFQYDFSLDHEAANDDLVLEHDGATLLVDKLSLEFLTGAEVDFTEDLSGSRFVVNNLPASRTCSCGASFAA